jgi:hypothetical protein
MILMCVVAAVRKNDIRVNALLQHLEPRFDLLTLLREKSVLKGHYLNFGTGRVRQKVGRGSPCFTLALTCTAEYAPMNVEANASIQQTQNRRSRANLNVI